MRTKEEWRRTIEEQEESALSCRQYCLANGINLETFYAARRRVKKDTPEVVKLFPTSSKKLSLLLNDKKVEIPFSSHSELKAILEVIRDV